MALEPPRRNKPPPLSHYGVNPQVLYSHQKAGRLAFRKFLRLRQPGEAAVFPWAPGSGKTEMGMMCILDHIPAAKFAQGRRGLLVTTNIQLAKQHALAFRKACAARWHLAGSSELQPMFFGFEDQNLETFEAVTSDSQGQFDDLRSRLFLVATVHQLAKLREQRQLWGSIDIMVCDEGHHMPAINWSEHCQDLLDRDKVVVYLTATPRRTDGRTFPGLTYRARPPAANGERIEHVVDIAERTETPGAEHTIPHGVKDGTLKAFDPLRSLTTLDVSADYVVDGQMRVGDRCEDIAEHIRWVNLADNPECYQLFKRAVLRVCTRFAEQQREHPKHGPYFKLIVTVKWVKLAKQLAEDEDIVATGLEPFAYYGEPESPADKERMARDIETFQAFSKHKRLCIQVDKLNEGFDCKYVTASAFLYDSKSPQKVVQNLGRTLRIWQDCPDVVPKFFFFRLPSIMAILDAISRDMVPNGITLRHRVETLDGPEQRARKKRKPRVSAFAIKGDEDAPLREDLLTKEERNLTAIIDGFHSASLPISEREARKLAKQGLVKSLSSQRRLADRLALLWVRGHVPYYQSLNQPLLQRVAANIRRRHQALGKKKALANRQKAMGFAQ